MNWTHVTSDQQVLFQLFKMASINCIPQTKIKLVLIGISNTLDLNSKFLPRLVRNNIQLDNLQFCHIMLIKSNQL